MKIVINWKKVLLYVALSISFVMISFVNIQWLIYPRVLFARSIMNEIDIISPYLPNSTHLYRSIALVIGSLPLLFGVGSFISQWENYKQMLLFVGIGLLCGFLGLIGRAIYIIKYETEINFFYLKLYDYLGYGMLLGVIICSLFIRKYNQVSLK